MSKNQKIKPTKKNLGSDVDTYSKPKNFGLTNKTSELYYKSQLNELFNKLDGYSAKTNQTKEDIYSIFEKIIDEKNIPSDILKNKLKKTINEKIDEIFGIDRKLIKILDDYKGNKNKNLLYINLYKTLENKEISIDEKLVKIYNFFNQYEFPNKKELTERLNHINIEQNNLVLQEVDKHFNDNNFILNSMLNVNNFIVFDADLSLPKSLFLKKYAFLRCYELLQDKLTNGERKELITDILKSVHSLDKIEKSEAAVPVDKKLSAEFIKLSSLKNNTEQKRKEWEKKIEHENRENIKKMNIEQYANTFKDRLFASISNCEKRKNFLADLTNAFNINIDYEKEIKIHNDYKSSVYKPILSGEKYVSLTNMVRDILNNLNRNIDFHEVDILIKNGLFPEEYNKDFILSYITHLDGSHKGLLSDMLDKFKNDEPCKFIYQVYKDYQRKIKEGRLDTKLEK